MAVEGLAPSSFKVWKYCRLMVLKSAVMATELIFVEGSAEPSAFKIAAWRDSSARRMADCLSPSAFNMAAAFSPSATVMLAWRFLPPRHDARRSRSAAICRFMACWMAAGGMISLISTAVILMPQRSATSSSLTRRTWLDLVAFGQNVVERDISPMTARRLVVAMPLQRAAEVLHVEDALFGDLFHRFVVDEEIDFYGRVVFGDGASVGDFHERFTQVDAAHVVRDRHPDGQAGAAQADEPPSRNPTARSYCRTILNGTEHRAHLFPMGAFGTLSIESFQPHDRRLDRHCTNGSRVVQRWQSTAH